MRILVTGANGYLGRGIVKELLDSGHEVIATDILLNDVDERAQKFQANLFEVEEPFLFFKEPDVLLHLAWRDGFIHYSDAHMGDLPLHCIFIKKMAESNVKSIAIMGSMHEIGFWEGCIDESTPCRPESFYGIAKNALRECATIYCHNNKKDFKWLRGFYIVGCDCTGSSIFSKIALAAKEGRKTFPFTLGLNQFDFLDYPIFCKQVSVAVGQFEVGGIINICSGRPEKLAERVQRYIDENGFEIELEYGKFPDRPYDSKAVWGNSTKMECIMKNGL